MREWLREDFEPGGDERKVWLLDPVKHREKILARGGVRDWCELVHGVRYRGDVVTERIEQLESGHELTLIPDPANEADPLAVGVHGSDGLLLGYVPKAFTRYVRALSTIAVSVDVASGPAVSYHLRLLVRLEGLLPAGIEPFAGPEWEPVSPMRTVGSAV